MQVRLYGTPSCLTFLRRNVFSFPKFLFSSTEHWVGALNINLLVVRSNPAGAYIIFTFQKIFKIYFWDKYILKFEFTQPVRVFGYNGFYSHQYRQGLIAL